MIRSAVNAIGKMSQTYFSALLTTCLMVDWLAQWPELKMFWGDVAVLELTENNFFRHVVETLMRSGLSFFTVVQSLWWLTLLAILFIYIPKFRGVAAFATWLLLDLWLSRKNAALNGVYFYFSFSLLLIWLAALCEDPGLVFRWGKVFLCLTYMNAGLAKIMSPVWRDAGVPWTLEIVNLAILGARTSHLAVPFYLPTLVVTWLMIISQLTAPVLFLPRNERWSAIWVILDSALHTVAGILSGLYLFSTVLIVLNFAVLPNQNSSLESESQAG